MGETVRGGAYRGVDGKIRNANGEVLDDTSEYDKWAKDRQKTQLAAAEKETGRPAKDIQAESEDRDQVQHPRAFATGKQQIPDPTPLGPLTPPDPTEASKAAEKSMAQAGVEGGRKQSK